MVTGDFEMKRGNVVYALVDPRTDDIRYVGATNDLPARIKSHLFSKPTGTRDKIEWLTELEGAGVAPTCVVLDQCETQVEMLQSEVDWTYMLRECGAPLTNRPSRTEKWRSESRYHLSALEIVLAAEDGGWRVWLDTGKGGWNREELRRKFDTEEAAYEYARELAARYNAVVRVKAH